MERMAEQENGEMVTRVESSKVDEVLTRFRAAEYHADAQMVILEKNPIVVDGKGLILVLSAGTSDIPVAKEAYLTAKCMGNEVESVFDVGVAGILRHDPGDGIGQIV